MPSSATPSTPRQQPGLACEECRRRKLRCDRANPRCTVCEELGIECTVNAARSRRGPKRGHLKALRGRIATLEALLERNNGEIDHQQQESRPHSDTEEPAPPSSSIHTSHNGLSPRPGIDLQTPEKPAADPYWIQDQVAAFAPTTPPLDFDMSDILEADLDQLYFDRVHPVASIIHHGRYLSWSKRSDKAEAQECLQFVMWALAASLSSHMQHTKDSLYACASKRLQDLDASLDFELGGTPAVEHAQAWVLFAHYEFRHMRYQRAWITAGRAFRIIQLAKFHELDRLNHLPPDLVSPKKWAEDEEKRRTFWLAYCLDHYINISHEWPLSFGEDTIWTCLPASETDFQNSRPVQSDYLSAAINASGERSQPPFAEAIVATTICWRGLSLKRMAPVPGACSSDAWHSIFPGYESLFQALKKRQSLMLVPQSYPQPLEPMRLFAHMLNHAAVVWMYLIMDGWHGEMDQHMYDDAYASACEVANLAEPLTKSSFFKAHTFSPMLLYIAAKLMKLYARSESSRAQPLESRDCMISRLKCSLRILQNANRLATKYLDVLDAEDMGGYCKTPPTLLVARNEDLQFTDEMSIFDWLD